MTPPGNHDKISIMILSGKTSVVKRDMMHLHPPQFGQLFKQLVDLFCIRRTVFKIPQRGHNMVTVSELHPLACCIYDTQSHRCTIYVVSDTVIRYDLHGVFGGIWGRGQRSWRWTGRSGGDALPDMQTSQEGLSHGGLKTRLSILRHCPPGRDLWIINAQRRAD